MSSSSSGIAVSFSKSSRSWWPGPQSMAGTCLQWCRALSMMPAKSHSALAEGFGRTARAMAALRRRRAIWISCIHLQCRDFADKCCPVSTEGEVCRVLTRSSDSWMRLPVRGPHQREVVNILMPQFSDFISVMHQFTFECRLCSISEGCRCNGGGHTHIQGRTACGNSSGSENISRPGCQGLPGSCDKLRHEHTCNATAWRFLRVPAVGPGRSHSIGTARLPPRLCCRVFSEHW